MKRIFAIAIFLISLPILTSAQQYYAILITGTSPDLPGATHSVQPTLSYIPPDWNNSFWNDTYLMHKTLIENGFDPAKIIVLLADGQEYPTLNPFYNTEANHIVTASASIQSVRDNLAYLNTVMTANDVLVVWTFGHGDGGNGNSSLMLYDGNMSDTEFSTRLPHNYKKRIILMAQCYSGGFIDNLQNSSTVILTACGSNETSQPADDINPDGQGEPDEKENDVYSGAKYSHSEFNYHVLNAIRGRTVRYNHVTPSDGDNSGGVSISETRDWEVNHDSQTPSFYTPQLSDPGNIAASTYINRMMDLAAQNASLSSTATSGNNQRKILRESTGTIHEVFESNGESYYHRSSDGGTTWQVIVRLSGGTGGTSAPCVTMAGSTIIAVWQRINGSNYDIQTSRSTNGGSGWSAAATLASIPCASPGPLPTVSGCDNSAFLAYRTSNGAMNAMKSTNAGASWTSLSAIPGSTSTCNSPSSMMYYTPWLVAQANLAYATDLPTGSPRIYFVYYDFDLSNWGGSTDITSVIPSQYTAHANPCLAVAPNPQSAGTVHVVWDASAPPPPPNTKLTIHRKMNFRSPGSIYSVLIGWGETRPSVASVQDDRLWMISQRNVTSYLQKRYYNGSSWQNPTSFAYGGSNPQVSVQRGTGAIPAKYLYTTGSQSPYQIVVGSDLLSKTGEATIYSRELNVIDSSSGTSVTLEVGTPSISLADGSTLPVDFNWSLDDSTRFDLPMVLRADATEPFTLPNDAVRLNVPMTVYGNNAAALFTPAGGSIALNLTDAKTSAVLVLVSSARSATIPASRGVIQEVQIAVNASLVARGSLRLMPSITGLRTDKKLIYSLGHVYRAAGSDSLRKGSITVQKEEIPLEVVLSESYPNPFNPTTTIRYSLPVRSHVVLRVFDALGRAVATLVNEDVREGYHEVRFDGSGLASGMYLARWQVNDDQGRVRYTRTNRLLLMK